MRESIGSTRASQPAASDITRSRYSCPAEGWTMITGLRGATIWSEDLGNLLPFSRDVLGLPVAVETPGFVVLGRREGPSLALGTHSEVHGRNADPARHMIGVTTDDLTSDYKRLKDAG